MAPAEASDARRWRMRDGALDRSAIKVLSLKGDALDLRISNGSTSAPEGAGTAASLLAKEVIPGITELGIPTALAVTFVQSSPCSSDLGAWKSQLSQYPRGRTRVKKEAWAGRGAHTGIIFATPCWQKFLFTW